MIKHHNFFKVHLPIKDYKGESEDELAEIIMEEFHLFSDGKLTKNYDSLNPKTDQFEISLYPSIPYLANKLNYSETEKFQFINDVLDNAFVDFLEKFNPLYKCTLFIEYHLAHFKGEKIDFYNHIKYQILTIVKERKKGKRNDFNYESLEQILEDWISAKIKEIEKKENSNTLSIESLIINNKSKIKNQSIGIEEKQEDSNWKKVEVIIAIIVGIVTIIGIIIGMIN